MRVPVWFVLVHAPLSLDVRCLLLYGVPGALLGFAGQFGTPVVRAGPGMTSERFGECFVPGVMEALKPGKDEGHASTEEIPR